MQHAAVDILYGISNLRIRERYTNRGTPMDADFASEDLYQQPSFQHEASLYFITTREGLLTAVDLGGA